MAVVIIGEVRKARLHAKNASIIGTMSSVHAAVDISKYPGSLTDLCLEFEAGGDLEAIRAGVEDNGEIWNCDSTAGDYRIFAKLNQEVIVSQNNLLGQTAHAQGTSGVHDSGNYYCLNSNFEKNYTHWSGYILAYPSCSDADYIDTPVDPE